MTELFYGVALVVAVAAASLSKQGLVRSWTRRARTRRSDAVAGSD